MDLDKQVAIDRLGFDAGDPEVGSLILADHANDTQPVSHPSCALAPYRVTVIWCGTTH
jgi:hypothetical protein